MHDLVVLIQSIHLKGDHQIHLEVTQFRAEPSDKRLDIVEGVKEGLVQGPDIFGHKTTQGLQRMVVCGVS